MKNWLIMLAVALIPVTAATVVAVDDKTPSTETIMKTLFAKKSGKFGTLKTQIEAPTPDWTELQKTAKEFANLGAALGKNDPEKGDKDSWKKLSDKFATDTKSLDTGAEAKDLAAVKAAQKAIGGSCKACHNVHRGN